MFKHLQPVTPVTVRSVVNALNVHLTLLSYYIPKVMFHRGSTELAGLHPRTRCKNWIKPHLLQWCHVTVWGYTQCLGPVIMASIDHQIQHRYYLYQLQGLGSWKNVKHLGNPRGVLVDLAWISFICVPLFVPFFEIKFNMVFEVRTHVFFLTCQKNVIVWFITTTALIHTSLIGQINISDTVSVSNVLLLKWVSVGIF